MLGTIFGFLTSFFAGIADPLAKIAGSIANERIAATNAKTEVERIAAQERSRALELRRDALIADRGSSWMRAALAFPVMLYINKLIVWDKVLGRGSTDDLSDNLWYIVMTVIGFYFLQSLVNTLRPRPK